MRKALVLILCAGLLAAQSRQIDNGTVAVVYDGDTIKVKFDSGSERRVRLIGIDTPEIANTSEETQLEALLAKRFTFHHLFRKRVQLGYDSEMEDKYGRLLAYVRIEGRLFNEFILKEGFARVFLKFPFAMKDSFIRAQEEARQEMKGFWQEKPYPLISHGDAKHHTGKLMRVSFTCARMRETSSFLYITPRILDFAALIPTEYRYLFGDIRRIDGKAIQVSGFLEEYRGQPQIMLFFPSQLTHGEKLSLTESMTWFKQ